MTASRPNETATLDPAFSLEYCGLNENAAMNELSRPLSKLLQVSPQKLPELLEKKPLLLGLSAQKDELENRQATLRHWGCQTQLQPVWRYRHWVLSQALIEILKILAARQSHAVFALLYVKPAPGIAVMRAMAKELSACDAYCLNHGQLLLQLDKIAEQGAGRSLLQIQQELEQTLSTLDPKSPHLILSSLALFPNDADTPELLLDSLSSRLLHFAKHETAQYEADNPRQVLARPLAGRPWARLVENQLNADDLDKLSHEQLGEIRRHWPLGQVFETDFAVTHSKPSARRYFQQYDASNLKRIDQCWELIHDSKNWDKLPSLPDIALEIYNLALDDNTEADQLTRLVSSDPALATRILSLVNSTYYGLKQKVDSLSHALVILGTQELAELALLVSSESVFAERNPDFGHKLWRHSAMTAEIARALAHRLQWPHPSALYVGALLHDVGKILLYDAYPAEMQRLENIARSNNLPMYEVEREHFGHDHASLGALMLRRWGLPEYICRRVETHHGPLPGETEMCEAAALIGVADHLAHRLSGSEPWADTMRLRSIHAQTLESELGYLDLDQVNGLLEKHGSKLRSERL